MIRSMLLRDEDSDPMDNLAGACWRLCFSLISWTMAVLAIVGLVNAL